LWRLFLFCQRFLACDEFRTNRRAIAMMFFRLSVWDGRVCDYMMH